jgi:hypothetical protein
MARIGAETAVSLIKSSDPRTISGRPPRLEGAARQKKAGTRACGQSLHPCLTSRAGLRKCHSGEPAGRPVEPDNKLLKRKRISAFALPLENPSKSLKIAPFSPI